MLSAIWRICFFECVRALRGLGLSASGETHLIWCMTSSFRAQVGARKASRPSGCVQIFEELRLRSRAASPRCGSLAAAWSPSATSSRSGIGLALACPAGIARRPVDIQTL